MLEFTKRNKSLDTAKNAGFGIANAATTLQQQQLQQLQLNHCDEAEAMRSEVQFEVWEKWNSKVFEFTVFR